MILRFSLILFILVVLAGCDGNEVNQLNLTDSEKKWNTAKLKWSEASLRILYQGERLYQKNCSACHGRDGKGSLNTIGAPALKKNGFVVGDKFGPIERLLRDPVTGAMPNFSESLTDKQCAAIVSYIRNAWGNNIGDIISDADVKSVR